MNHLIDAIADYIADAILAALSTLGDLFGGKGLR